MTSIKAAQQTVSRNMIIEAEFVAEVRWSRLTGKGCCAVF
jgi:hypothetical protein